MDQSPLANVLSHLAQLADQQHQLQQAQGGVLAEMAHTLAEDRTVLRGLVAAGVGTEAEPRIQLQKMGEQDDAEAFLATFRSVAEVSRWLRQEWAHHLLPLLTREAQRGPQPPGRSPGGL